MFTWQIASAIAVVLLVLFVWWLNGRGQRRRSHEFDREMKRSAQTWKERHS